jgi:hypothetical protein
MGEELRIRLTPEERRRLDEAALAAFKGDAVPGRGITSTWARETLLKAAQRALK